MQPEIAEFDIFVRNGRMYFRAGGNDIDLGWPHSYLAAGTLTAPPMRITPKMLDEAAPLSTWNAYMR